VNYRLTVSVIFVLRDLRFSPDGRHVLAQNGSEITPDSRRIVFVSGGTRLDPGFVQSVHSAVTAPAN
jgi:hypothetical protein